MSLRDYYDFFQSLSPQTGLEGSEVLEEIEYMFFYLLDDFEQLKAAKYKESQEQWSLLFRKDGVENIIRVRKTIKGEETTFILASKTKFYDLDGKWEVETEVERQHFDKVKEMAEDGMIKDRYFFPVDGTSYVWEVDVFFDHTGKPYPWVKVDLEVDARMLKENLPKFPLVHLKAITNQAGERTENEEQLVRKLFDECFSIKNPHK